MSWRPITIDGFNYRWKSGVEFITIQDENGKCIARRHKGQLFHLPPGEDLKNFAVLPSDIVRIVRSAKCQSI